VTIESIKKLFILSLLYENFLKNPPNINCKQAPNNKRTIPAYASGQPLFGDADDFYMEFAEAYTA
jgi:hypothetical protein